MIVVTAYSGRGEFIFPYLDDWLLRDKSRDKVLAGVQFMLSFFDHSGLILNSGKLTLVPTQRIKLVGSLLDSEFESISAD